jgi:hypothetical protein
VQVRLRLAAKRDGCSGRRCNDDNEDTVVAELVGAPPPYCRLRYTSRAVVSLAMTQNGGDFLKPETIAVCQDWMVELGDSNL